MKIDNFIKILGVPWHVMTSTREKEPRFKDLDGFTDWTSNTICVIDPDSVPECDLDNPIEMLKHVFRHEIIHAFLFSSGLGSSWQHASEGHCETTVDWFARQFHEIEEVVKTVEEIIDDEKKRCK